MTGKRRVIWFVAVIAVVAALTFLFSGCKSGGAGRIYHTAEETTLFGIKDAGKPATLDSASSVASLPIPAGSSLVMTKFEAVAPALATDRSPAVAAQPAKEVVEVKLNGSTEWRKTENAIKADTGTIDTSVAKHRIDVEERGWLLKASGILVLLAIVTHIWVPGWPSIPRMCWIAAGCAFAAWKLAEIPTYLWAVSLGIGLLVVVVYKRREKDEREEKEELAKAKAIAVPVVVPVDPPRPT